MKPALTKEQIEIFEALFKELVKKEPKALNIWDGQFYWILDKPKLDHITKSFSDKGKDKYVTLLNKLNSRTI